MLRIRSLPSAFVLIGMASAPACGQGSQYGLRFFGTGVGPPGQQDRVRIPIDDDAPGSDASAPCDVGAGDFTVEFWLRGSLANNASSNNGGDVETADFAWINGSIVVDRDLFGGSERDWGISIAGGFVRFGTGRGDGATPDVDNTIEGNVMVLDGAWHHVAVTRTAATGVKRIYVDGLLDFASSPGASTVDISYPDNGAPGQATPWGPYIVLGAEKHDAGASFPSFNGYFDELRIWTTARTSMELLSTMDRVIAADASGLVAYYRFEEGTGAAVADSSAAGSPVGQLIAGVPGNGEWVAYAVNPAHTAPVTFEQLPSVVVVAADPTQGSEPLAVQFSSTGTFDPDGGPQPLSYDWTFGDGNTSTLPNPAHTYTQRGQYMARLTAWDGAAATQSAPIAITVGNPPSASIDAPPPGTLYRAGDLVSFSGSAVDLEDGVLPPSAFSWRVVWRRLDQQQTIFGPLAGVASGGFNIPSTGHPPESTYYEIELTVTDSDGMQTIATRAVNPVIAALTIDSVPSGIPMSLDGETVATPRVYASISNYQHLVEAPATFDLGGVTYQFVGWTDCGPRAHTYVAPEGGGTLTAYYRAAASSAMVQVDVATDDRDADYHPAFGQRLGNAYDTDNLCAGRDADGHWQAAAAFALNVPRGAAILSATLRVTAANDNAGSPGVRISGYDAANVAPFTVSATPLTLHAPLTMAFVDWAMPAFVTGQPYDTPDLAALVQAVVSRGDWDVGAYFGLVLDGTPSAVNNWRCFRNSPTGDRARLTVQYAVAGGAAGDFDFDSDADSLDLATFVDVLLELNADCIDRAVADLTGDGITDADDIAPFVNTLF